ncbi:MAG: hypothetical protein E6K81_04870 [Candidatus Eisenbacteria bacterium]|uniref:ATP-binding protein n=1 Tax=Eiseniibacteriota bacterium TaxID=2212470 RepID=A0A538UBT2_UNCEI|nr:MAG: hypothetical protein E6K81_04870 [Candidatus Eisenbacteria bacterium]
MGETRVDLHHLLEDLRDAYSGALEETILTEIVANALDSGASLVRILADPARAALTVVDDGSGMQRRDLARYHDIAASTKTRGEGIGFAGVGIKLGLLLSEQVLTETRRGKSHVATRWHLASRHKAPWKWVPPPGLVAERGTAVTLELTNPLSPLLDAGFVEGTLRRHYQPLLEPAFDELLLEHYRRGVRFEVNGQPLERTGAPATERAPMAVRLGRKRKPSAVGYLVREAMPLPEEHRGLAISTLGKVIKRGWDWLGVTPATPDSIGGVIEIPALAECLTLNKADFIRTGPRGATYLAYRKAVQEAVSQQLALWGDARDHAEETKRRAARPVERDLERVLADLAEDFPLLGALVERHRGGQRKLPIGRPGGASDAHALIAEAVRAQAEAQVGVAEAPETPAAAVTEPTAAATREAGAASPDTAGLPGESGPRRPTRYGLAIQFEARPGEPEIGRLVESTVWINESHPAYRRAVASRSEGYHLALAVALALAPLAAEPAHEHAFVLAFLEHWGTALETDGRRGRLRNPAPRRLIGT